MYGRIILELSKYKQRHHYLDDALSYSRSKHTSLASAAAGAARHSMLVSVIRQIKRRCRVLVGVTRVTNGMNSRRKSELYVQDDTMKELIRSGFRSLLYLSDPYERSV